MSWLFSRILAGTVLVLLSGGIGHRVGARVFEAPLAGTLAGAVFGMSLVLAFDAWRAARLLRWLRSDQSGTAPRDAGTWGEFAYRIERALRKREAQAAREKRRLAQFLSAIEASPNGVMMIDAGKQIVWCNRTCAQHFGLHPERDLRQRVTNLVRAPAFVAHLQSGHPEAPVIFANPRGDGVLSVLIRPYGEGMRLVISQDITERDQAERMRRDFVANVSHEIRTPLTVLAGFIETLRDLPLDDVERRRVLELMGQQTARMQRLVGDLLTLAQLEGSPPPPSDQWVPVQQLLDQVEVDARTLSQARHRLSFGTGGQDAIAGADGELLSALLNLVSNAIRYTPQGGEVDVQWRFRADGAGEFSVRDTGAGIDKAHLPRLTERFYRVDGSRSRETGGTGLGLSIVKHVVQRHGGELEVHSEPGQGSVFRLVYPAFRVRRGVAVPPAQGGVPSLPPTTDGRAVNADRGA